MAEVKWIKIVTDIFDDEKILIIESMPEADAMIVIWFKLLCLAGKQNNSGVFTINHRIAYTDEMFSAIFRRPINTVRLALKTFENLGMVEIVNGTVTIPNWGKHQSLDRINSRNEYMRNYMREYREKQKSLSSGDTAETGCKANSKANVSALDIEEEGDIEGEGDKENSGGGSTCSFDSGNPFGDYDPHRHLNPDTLEAYASSNLRNMSSNNMDELVSFRDSLPDDVIRHAIDEACGAGVPVYNYVRSILNRYVEKGFKTLGDVKAYEAERQQKGGSQHGITNDAYQRAPRRIGNETIL